MTYDARVRTWPRQRLAATASAPAWAGAARGRPRARARARANFGPRCNVGARFAQRKGVPLHRGGVVSAAADAALLLDDEDA